MPTETLRTSVPCRFWDAKSSILLGRHGICSINAAPARLRSYCALEITARACLRGYCALEITARACLRGYSGARNHCSSVPSRQLYARNRCTKKAVLGHNVALHHFALLRFTPCMSMHGFTLYCIYICGDYIYITYGYITPI